MSKISTHVLDTVLGKPAAGMLIRLERLLSPAGSSREGARGETQWITNSTGKTDADGRCNAKSDAAPGVYRLTFQIGAYLKVLGRNSIYPEASVTFECDGLSHYHLPLLLSDNSYTTYRGS
jgi:5-hydroxyisourate hydrolase